MKRSRPPHVRRSKDAQLPPSAISAVELGSLGVPALDACELSALDEVYGSTRDGQPLALGSLRPQIGDLAGASTMASVLKASYCLERGELAPTAEFAQPAPALKHRQDRFFVPQRRQALPATSPQGYRAVALNSLQEDMAFHLILDNGAPLRGAIGVRH